MNTRETELTLAHAGDAYSVATMSREIIEHGLQWSWTPERVGRCILSPDINVITAVSYTHLTLPTTPYV